ncbi:C-type mannose receptor 2-like [Ruditapes philippinarum]|uniref:C-type mannose receptor 2-like n=1 Tax=Ruditapes philippinarum TaxID=129788 RepID=UPI00295B7A52|nr:C-type mannose receptor 2-like [Ruditapes philippinarum]
MTCVQLMKAKPFLTWQKARDSCISMNADLLSVNDKEENGKLNPLVRAHIRSRDLLQWWIGIREVGHSWLWLDNDEKYAKIPEWAAGSGRFQSTPDNKCGLFTFKGTLEEAECEQEKPYICEKFNKDIPEPIDYQDSYENDKTQDGSSVSADTEGPKCDLPWEKLHRTCVQFMIAKPFSTWQKARDSCISMNADLLSVNGNEENGKLNPLVRAHIRSRDLLQWWIGIREVGHSWLWLDNDEKYAKIPEWAAGSGRFQSKPGKCGLFTFKGTLEEAECEQEKPYICEQFKERSLGETCYEVSQCLATQNVQCTGTGTKTCNCQSGYYTITDSNRCLKRSLGETCNEVSQCSATQNVQCTGTGTKTCNCQSGYYTITDINRCLKRSLGETCDEVSQCSATQNVQCTGTGTKTCNCQSGYYTITDINRCQKRSLGETCDEVSQCSATQNVQCTGTGTKTCNCQSGYYTITDSNHCLRIRETHK